MFDFPRESEFNRTKKKLRKHLEDRANCEQRRRYVHSARFFDEM